MIGYENLIKSCARVTHRRYRSYISYEDLESVGFLWMLEHPKMIDEFNAEPEETLGAWAAQRELFRVMDRAARKEKASRSGYETDDEQGYSETVLNLFLPYVLHNDPVPPVREPQEGSSGKDPAHGQNWLVMWIDVKRAWTDAGLTPAEQDLMEAIHKYGEGQQALAERLGLSQSTVSRRYRRATRKLSDELGGLPGSDCPYDCECHEGPLRRRPGGTTFQLD